MALQKTIFRPGIYREGTDYDNEGGASLQVILI